jgi:hypothetical protein
VCAQATATTQTGPTFTASFNRAAIAAQKALAMLQPVGNITANLTEADYAAIEANIDLLVVTLETIAVEVGGEPSTPSPAPSPADSTTGGGFNKASADVSAPAVSLLDRSNLLVTVLVPIAVLLCLIGLICGYRYKRRLGKPKVYAEETTLESGDEAGLENGTRVASPTVRPPAPLLILPAGEPRSELAAEADGQDAADTPVVRFERLTEEFTGTPAQRDWHRQRMESPVRSAKRMPRTKSVRVPMRPPMALQPRSQSAVSGGTRASTATASCRRNRSRPRRNRSRPNCWLRRSQLSAILHQGALRQI